MAVIATMLVASQAASADEVGEARMRTQLRQTVTELRQLQDENADLKAKLDAATKQPVNQPEPVKVDDTELVGLRRSLQSQTLKTESLQKQVDLDKKTLGEWQKSYDLAVTTAKARDAEAKKYEALYKEVSGGVQACNDKNAKLIEISEQLLDRYKNKGVMEAARHTEPLLGIHRVELENLIQEYHGKIVDSTVIPANAEASPPQEPQPPQQQSNGQ